MGQFSNHACTYQIFEIFLMVSRTIGNKLPFWNHSTSNPLFQPTVPIMILVPYNDLSRPLTPTHWLIELNWGVCLPNRRSKNDRPRNIFVFTMWIKVRSLSIWRSQYYDYYQWFGGCHKQTYTSRPKPLSSNIFTRQTLTWISLARSPTSVRCPIISKFKWIECCNIITYSSTHTK